MSDTVLRALAQVIYQAGRLDERGLAVAPLEAPLDALLAEARATFEQLDRLGALPTVERPHLGQDTPPPPGRSAARRSARHYARSSASTVS